MTFRKATRDPRQILSDERAEQILRDATSGVLCLRGDDEYPYGVPMSYAYDDGKIYFHGAVKGHKIDAMKACDNVCFTVIETDQIVPEEYTTYYRGVMAFGKIRLVEDPEGKREGLYKLVDKYSADFKAGADAEIESKLAGVSVFVIDVEYISGKEAIEFAEMLERAGEAAVSQV